MMMKLLALAMLAFSGCVAAESPVWPDKPVTLVVPYPAGAGVDPVARLVGKHLSELWGQPVVVSNKAGGSGSIGAAFVARSNPDGLTGMMSATAEVVINQFIMVNMQYDPDKDLRPVTLAVRLPFVLLANPKQPYATAAELVAFARRNPDKVTYASSGQGTPQHLAAVLFEQLAGVRMTHVPYKGVAPSITALIAGEVDIGFAGLPAGLPHVRAGNVRALGLSSPGESPAAPEIPPLGRTPGLAGFDLTQWFGIFVPAATPEPIVKELQLDVAKVLSIPEVRRALEDQGAVPSGMPTAEFEAFVRSEREKFGRIAKGLSIQ